jgi:hypothetical protein
MTKRRWGLAVAVLAAILAARLCSPSKAAPGERATPMLDAVVHFMASVRDYSVTIDAHETDASAVDDRIIRFWFREPQQAKIEVVKGPAAGTRLVWTGGDRAHVRGGIFSWLPVYLDLHDPRIVSLRGNTMLRAEFKPGLDCFVAHRDAVTESPGPKVDGQATVLVSMMIPSGVNCPADSAKDRSVTKDVLTALRSSATVVKRERYVGDTLVERWTLSEMKFNPGLTDADFR